MTVEGEVRLLVNKGGKKECHLPIFSVIPILAGKRKIGECVKDLVQFLTVSVDEL